MRTEATRAQIILDQVYEGLKNGNIDEHAKKLISDAVVGLNGEERFLQAAPFLFSALDEYARTGGKDLNLTKFPRIAGGIGQRDCRLSEQDVVDKLFEFAAFYGLRHRPEVRGIELFLRGCWGSTVSRVLAEEGIHSLTDGSSHK